MIAIGVRRRVILPLFFLSIAFAGYTQTNPANGLFNDRGSAIIGSVQINATYFLTKNTRSGDMYKVAAYVSIPPDKHIYSTVSQAGIMPTRIDFKSTHALQGGPTRESKPIELFDFTLRKKIRAHKNQFELTRLFTLSSKPLDTTLPMELHFQICDQRICSLPVSKRFDAVYLN